MTSAKRILVAVDFSACSREALDYALEYAERLGATLDVLHVYGPPLYGLAPDTPVEVSGKPTMSFAQYMHACAEEELALVVRDASDRHPDVDITPRLRPGDAVKTVLDATNSGDYDVLIIGTHGRGALSRLLLGSVANKVIRRAVIPVLTIRQSKKASAKRDAKEIAA